MGIKINEVKIFRGTHSKVVSKYFQVLGFHYNGNQPIVKTVQEGKELPKLLATLKNMGFEWKADAERVWHPVYIPEY